MSTPEERFAAQVQRLNAGQLTEAELRMGCKPLAPAPAAPHSMTKPDPEFAAQVRLPAAGQVTAAGDPIDRQLLEQCNAWRASLGAGITSAERAEYEENVASVYAGRRSSESIAMFRARQAGVAAATDRAADAAKWAADEAAGVALYVTPDQFLPEHLHGYRLNGIPAGVTIEGVSWERMLKEARAAGVSQAQVDSYVKSKMANSNS